MISRTIEKTTIPNDYEAEQAVLGAIMLDNSTFQIALSIIKSPACFYTPSHQHIFRSMIELSEKNDPIGSISLGDELKSLNQLEEVGGYAYLSSLEDCGIDYHHIAKWCKIIIEHSHLRQIVALTHDYSRKARDPESEAKDLIDELFEKLLELRGNLSTNSKAVSVFSCLPEIINNIELAHSKKMEIGLISGYDKFDRQLGGGAQLGDVIFIGAKPSVGKTSLAMCLSYSMVHRAKKGLIISLESSKESLIRDRLLPSAISVNSHALRAGSLQDDEWDNLSEVCGSDMLKNLKICDSSTMTINDIYSLVNMEYRSSGIDFLMIDFVQLVKPVKDTGNRNQDLGTIGTGIKKICKDFNIPAIVLSQLNEKDKLRDSGELLQIADVVINLEKDEEQPDIINCIFSKNRNGIKGKVPLEFIPEFTQFNSV